MAGKKREDIREEDITGLKYFDKLLPLFEPLHEVGCERDKAGNRTLHYDQYCSLLLLFLFNPTVTSLRGLQQASELKKVQRILGCKRASLGSLSESTSVFEPELLKRIIEELGSKIQPVHNVGGGHVKHTLMAVDGSVVKTLATITQAAYLKNCHGASKSAWRLHTHFDIEHHMPRRIDVTSGKSSGKASENNVLRKALQPDHCYVMDRGYAEFRLFNDIHATKSSYVCRIRDNSRYKIIEERPLSQEARDEGVLFDGIVELGLTSKPEKRPNHPVRLILIKTTPHTQRGKQPGGKTGPSSDGILRIVTNLVDDVPAEIIGNIFRHRWMVEIFFRFFKHILGCRHLLSQSPKGVEIQAYMAIIACMLISLWTGRKPTLRTYEMVCHYFSGLADEEELLAHIAKLPPHDA